MDKLVSIHTVRMVIVSSPRLEAAYPSSHLSSESHFLLSQWMWDPLTPSGWALWRTLSSGLLGYHFISVVLSYQYTVARNSKHPSRQEGSNCLHGCRSSNRVGTAWGLGRTGKREGMWKVALLPLYIQKYCSSI